MTDEVKNSILQPHYDEEPTIGVFKATDRLILQPAPNGGWIVSSHNGETGFRDEVIGAYGSASEMINAMHAALVDPPI